MFLKKNFTIKTHDLGKNEQRWDGQLKNFNVYGNMIAEMQTLLP